MDGPLKLSIIIVNFESAEFLERCLVSIQNHVIGINYEICVVDNGSSDYSVSLLKEKFPGVRVVANGHNAGFAHAVNQGMAATSMPYILWLNPDAEFLDGGIKDLLDYLESHADTGILGLRILNPDGSRQLSCRSFPSWNTALFNRYSLLTRLFPSNTASRNYLRQDIDSSQVQEVDWVSGSALLHRRKLINSIGLLDQSFFMYCEDVDFCKRAKQAGWKVMYHPGAAVMHRIGGSSRRAKKRMIVERHRSIWQYYKKHFARNPLFDICAGAGIFFRCMILLTLSFFQSYADIPENRKLTP